MKKQTDLHPIKRHSSIILTVILIIAGAALSVFAQDTPKFKIGDRVECDATGSRTYWNKGTVIAFKDGDMYNGYAPESGYFYRVRMDKIPDVPEGYLVKAEDMRPLGGAKPTPNRNETETRNEPGKNTEPKEPNDAEDEAAAQTIKTPEGKTCGIVATPKTKGTASAELFKAIIKAQYDKLAKPGLDGAVCLEFTGFQMGAPQQWRPESDPRRVGTDRLGTKPKTIYPVKANFRVITDYNTVWETTDWTGTVFTCFKDEAFGDWKCRGEQGFDWQYKSKRIEK
jgi:hypothetical protein